MLSSLLAIDATSMPMSQRNSRAAVLCQECSPSASDTSIGELGGAWQRVETMSARRVPEVPQALLQRRQRHFQQGCRTLSKGGLPSHATLVGA